MRKLSVLGGFFKTTLRACCADNRTRNRVHLKRRRADSRCACGRKQHCVQQFWP